MIRSYRYRLYPTKLQEVALADQLWHACMLYNAALQERRDAWRKVGKSIQFAEQARQIKYIRAAGDMGSACSYVAHDVVRRVDRAFAAFFRRCKAGESKVYKTREPARHSP